MFKKRKLKKAAVLVFWAVFFFCIHVSAEEEQKADESKTSQLQQRIDFGNAYIMGQSIKSGAVYLLHRKKSDISSMLEVREDYRKEIIEDFALEDTQMIPKETDE